MCTAGKKIGVILSDFCLKNGTKPDLNYPVKFSVQWKLFLLAPTYS